MPPHTPLISILVLNYKGRHLLPDCLDSLEAQDFKDWELVYVDNHSEDGSPDWVRTRMPKATVVENPENRGFAGGNNRGLPYCQGEWVFFLNNDTALEPGCLSALASAIASRKPEDQVLAPLMLQWEHPERVDSGGDELYTSGLVYKYEDLTLDHPFFQAPREIAMACGGAVLFKKSLLDLIGGFDEDFFLLFEDVDLSLRARHAGARLWLIPQARLRHKGSASIGRLSKTNVYYSNRNLFWAKAKNYPFLTLLKYAPLELLTTLTSLKGSLVNGVFPTWLKARSDCLLGLPRMWAKRRAIQASSRLGRSEFEQWLRKGWLARRIKH